MDKKGKEEEKEGQRQEEEVRSAGGRGKEEIVETDRKVSRRKSKE